MKKTTELLFVILLLLSLTACAGAATAGSTFATDPGRETEKTTAPQQEETDKNQERQTDFSETSSPGNGNDDEPDYDAFIELLKRDYGSVIPQQFSNHHAAGEAADMETNGWTVGTGILNSLVYDLDRDDEDELLVVMIQKKTDSSFSGTHTVVYPELIVYESRNGDIEETGRKPLDMLHPTDPYVADIDYNESLGCLNSLYLYTGGEIPCVIAEIYEYGVFADGYNYGYFFFEYDGKDLVLSRYVYMPPASGEEKIYYGVNKDGSFRDEPVADAKLSGNSESDSVRWVMQQLGVNDEAKTDEYFERYQTWKNTANSTLLTDIRIVDVPNQDSWSETDFIYSVSQSSFVLVRFEYSYAEDNFDMEYGVFTATDSSNKERWCYVTKEHFLADLRGFGSIGIANGMYYLYEDNHVIALDLSTGVEAWRCPFSGGDCSFTFDDAGTLYICGYYGPDLAIIDKNGKLLKQIDTFDENYYWPNKIIRRQNEIIVLHSGGPDGYTEEGYACVVNLSDYSYTILPAGEL